MNKHLQTFIITLILIFIISACSNTEIDTGVYKKSTYVENNLLKSIPSPWVEIKSEGADFALNNSKTGSYFLFNSACRNYQMSDLNNLTTSILSGIGDIEIVEKKMTTHQNREAAIIIARGSLDGVTRFFKILTTLKNNCIYDFALISINQNNFKKDDEDFYKFIQLLKLN